jgi:hypothetical protein
MGLFLGDHVVIQAGIRIAPVGLEGTRNYPGCRVKSGIVLEPEESVATGLIWEMTFGKPTTRLWNPNLPGWRNWQTHRT